MQTLTAGSFLNLENDASVEALKFTARRLAEYSGNVVTENLNATGLENLANSLWEKAAYVTRETERRRLKQIFNENFSERFRELKPEVSSAESANLESSTIARASSTADSVTQPPAPGIVESERAATEVTSLTAAESPENPTEVEGKKDEFLGFVESGEPFIDAPVEGTETVKTTVPEQAEQTAIQNVNETVAENLKPENQSVETRKPNSENQSAGDEPKPLTENENNKQSEPATAAVAAKNDSPGGVEVKNKTQVSATDAAKEPFELGKCTVNLNLVLLPTSASGERRKVIVSAMSHNLPPEIDFLEITESEDLNEIAALVRDKLARFKQTLPAKYIEQLRAAKPKTAKKSSPEKTTVAAPTNPPAGQAKDEKASGERKAEQGSSSDAAKPQSAAEQNNTHASSTAFAPQVVKPIAANEIQGSLF